MFRFGPSFRKTKGPHLFPKKGENDYATNLTQSLLKLALILDVMLYVPGKYNSQGLRAN